LRSNYETYDIGDDRVLFPDVLHSMSGGHESEHRDGWASVPDDVQLRYSPLADTIVGVG
jgi:hypothetical protein